ncbi:MAG TPA: hypothetical protein VL026_02340 [Rhizomicrobium sp.]|nr:hypothetical protein [Rhizomicrobium sp.]
MSDCLDPIEPKIERVIHMATRLIEALEADIAALERGKPAEMRTTHPEIQKLTAVYGRETAGLTPDAAAKAPAPLRASLLAVTKAFADVLARHARIVIRVRNASDGMIRAIAEEVDRRNAPSRTYARTPASATRAPGAMLFNSVV